MIIEKYKTIFIHIPKNAGTSIEEYFGNNSFKVQPNKHDNIYDIKKMFPNPYNNYRKFTVIRNPYDKMVSWYFYLRRNTFENVSTKGDVIEFTIKEGDVLTHSSWMLHRSKPYFGKHRKSVVSFNVSFNHTVTNV